MHEVLDGDASASDAWELRKHLAECEHCREIYYGMETSEALVRSMPGLIAPSGMTERIMGNLPAKKSSTFFHWLKRHPGISVAVLFLILMMGSIMTAWNTGKELVIKGVDLELDEVVIKGNTVYIPPGKTIEGDLVVQGAQLELGDNVNVKGNLTVIDGKLLQASTAHIAGQVTEIDEMFGWIWYKFTEFIDGLRQ